MRHLGIWLLVASIAVIATAYAERRPLLTELGRFLIVADPPQAADAIVVLSGSIPDRILEAVDLYQAHFAPRIILTQDTGLPGIEELHARGASLPGNHEQNLSVAHQLGVPPAALTVLPPTVGSTFAEAQTVIPYLRAQHFRSILLVTSKAHARRARLIFRTLAAGDPAVAICPSPYDPFAAETWWQRREFVRRLIIEYGKLLYFGLVDRWRLTLEK